MVEPAYHEDDNDDDKTPQVQPLATALRPTTSVYSNDDYDPMEGTSSGSRITSHFRFRLPPSHFTSAMNNNPQEDDLLAVSDEPTGGEEMAAAESAYHFISNLGDNGREESSDCTTRRPTDVLGLMRNSSAVALLYQRAEGKSGTSFFDISVNLCIFPSSCSSSYVVSYIRFDQLILLQIN